LPEARYRLTVAATLADPAGNALDGDEDGVAGGAFVAEFTVADAVTAAYAQLAAPFEHDTHYVDVYSDADAGDNHFAPSGIMNGATTLNQDWLDEAPAPWRMCGTGDFNADGKPDILWRNPSTGRNLVWFMDGPTTIGTADLENVATAWHVGGVADFDGDGKPDILWRNNATNQVVIMLMDGVARKGMAWQDNVPAPWDIAGAADFDVDGSPDILWNNPNSGRNVIMLMNHVTKRQLIDIQATPQGWGWSMAGAGIFH
jgi:hypothetical protein